MNPPDKRTALIDALRVTLCNFQLSPDFKPHNKSLVDALADRATEVLAPTTPPGAGEEKVDLGTRVAQAAILSDIPPASAGTGSQTPQYDAVIKQIESLPRIQGDRMIRELAKKMEQAYMDSRFDDITKAGSIAIWKALQEIAPWSESNDMPWEDEILCGLSLAKQNQDDLTAQLSTARQEVEEMKQALEVERGWVAGLTKDNGILLEAADKTKAGAKCVSLAGVVEKLTDDNAALRSAVATLTKERDVAIKSRNVMNEWHQEEVAKVVELESRLTAASALKEALERCEPILETLQAMIGPAECAPALKQLRAALLAWSNKDKKQ